MWLLVSIPMVLIFTILVSGYLQKDKIYEEGKEGVNIKKIIPNDPKSIIFLVVAFIFGVTAFLCSIIIMKNI